MASQQRRAGLIQVQVDGLTQDAKGAFDYNLGAPKREAIVGSDGIHGFKEMPQVAFIEGKITDRQTLDVKALALLDDATVTLSLANGKTVKFGHAFYAADGKANTEEGEIEVRFECDPSNAQEI